MKRTFILLLTLVLCLPLLRAQEESLNTFSVDLGMGRLKKQDLKAIPQKKGRLIRITPAIKRLVFANENF